MIHVYMNKSIESELETKPMFSKKSKKNDVTVIRPKLNFMAAVEKLMTPDDIVNRQHKDQLQKINEMT